VSFDKVSSENMPLETALVFHFNFTLINTKMDIVITNEVRTTLLGIPMKNSTPAERHAACQEVLCRLWILAYISKLLQTTASKHSKNQLGYGIADV
jgi:hypothetical protein